MIFAYLQHRRDWSALSIFIPKFKVNISQSSRSKQHERQERIKALAPIFHQPISPKDQHILGLPISTFVSQVQNGQQDPVDILTAYGKKALEAHKETNCLTEVMIAAAVGWAKDCNRAGPLAGTPVSLKDVSFSIYLRQRVLH
jgi:Asp-tRNA(Asn)/Glu-tRNA(Gln) amidotransferase A subunit family amidase